MKKPDTAAKILRAAHRLFDREGADAVTMRRVAERVGITPMAIYRHFPSREALLKRLSDDSFNSTARQWLEIAMVLAGGPDLLLLDEPTAGMAPEETGATAAVLRDLNSTGLTILVVEHDMAFVREIARRVTVLHQGRVFADGTIDEVTERQDVRDIYLGRR